MPDTPYHGIDNLEVLTHAVRYSRFLVDQVVRAGHGALTAVDFGAGTGSLSELARERGMKVACVEPDASLRERLRAMGFEVHDDVGRLPEQSQEFIYSLNVLEHIENDEGALAALFARLKPGGRCLLYVPALQALYSSMDRKIGHYRRYHRGDLLRIARRVGFAIERAEYADSLGVPVTLLYKIVGNRRGDVSVASVKLYDRLLFPVSRLFDRLGFSRLLGKNLLVVMRRPPHTGEAA
jgi:SAM-dependent methyltransferase